jgi:SAM-dependent methyltransferase
MDAYGKCIKPRKPAVTINCRPGAGRKLEGAQQEVPSGRKRVSNLAESEPTDLYHSIKRQRDDPRMPSEEVGTSEEIERLLQASRYWALGDEPGWEGKEEAWIRFFSSVMTVASYLEPTGSILSVGPGSARYGVHMHRCGYRVAFTGLSEEHLRSTRGQVESPDDSYITDTREAEPEDLGDLVAGLRSLDEAAFDAALAFGVYYRLRDEQELALLSAGIRRVLKPGGIIAVELRPEPARVLELLRGMGPGSATDTWARLDGLMSLEQTTQPDGAEDREWRLARVADIPALLGGVGFEEQEITASEGIASWLPASTWEGAWSQGRRAFDRLLSLISTASDEPDVVGLSKHALYIGEKTEQPVGRD